MGRELYGMLIILFLGLSSDYMDTSLCDNLSNPAILSCGLFQIYTKLTFLIV